MIVLDFCLFDGVAKLTFGFKRVSGCCCFFTESPLLEVPPSPFFRLEISPKARRRRCCCVISLGVFVGRRLFESDDARDLVRRTVVAFSLLCMFMWRGVRVARAEALLRNMVLILCFERFEVQVDD